MWANHDSPTLIKARSVYETLRRFRPRSRQDLKNYVKVFLGIDVPDVRICPEHSSPMDYLWHSFAVDFLCGAWQPQAELGDGGLSGRADHGRPSIPGTIPKSCGLEAATPDQL